MFSRGKRGSGPRGLLPGSSGASSGNTNGRDQLLMSTDPLIDDEDEDRGSQVGTKLKS